MLAFLLDSITAGQVVFSGVGITANAGTPDSISDFVVPYSIFEEPIVSHTRFETFGLAINNLTSAVGRIPTNPLLDDIDGSQFDSIPDMAKESTLTDIKGSDFEVDVDSLVNLSHEDIEITAQIVRDAMALNVTSGTTINSESIDAKLNAIPTNPMLNNANGSTFTLIPDMAKESTLNTLSGVINSEFSLAAKESTLTDMKGLGFVPNTDSLVNLSHTDIEVTAQIIRDAMKLSPSSGTIPIDSIDGKIDALTGVTLVPVANFDPY